VIRRALLAAATALALVPAAGAVDGLTVSVDRTAVSARLGQKFELRSTIANHGASTASGLIAHLNVLSLRGGVYVDPEDWSSHRTRYVSPIPAGASRTLTWRLSTVSPGLIGVYVAVLPANGKPVPPTTGATVRVSIADRRTLDSGGILPLALGLPAALGVLLVAFRQRRARR
jgi:hypothetical protein